MPGDDQSADRTANMPPHPVRPPHPRHILVRITESSWARKKNSVIDPSVDIDGDIDAINQGNAIRRGDTYRVSGRSYRLEHGGRVYPVDGPGVHLLTRLEYMALRIYNARGLTADAEMQLDYDRIPASDRETARRLWQLGRQVE